MNYTDFSKASLLIMDVDDFPINLAVQLIFGDEDIRFKLQKGIDFVKNQKCKLQLKIVDHKQLFFRTILFEGKIQKLLDLDQYKFIIETESHEIIDSQNNLISQLVSMFPDGKQPIKEFNLRLFNEIITEKNKGLLIMNIAHNTHIHRIMCVPNSGKLEFETVSGNKLSSILRYAIEGTIIFDQKEMSLGEISINGDIKLVKRLQNSDVYSFVPKSMTYGNQSNMETLQISNDTQLRRNSLYRKIIVKTKYWYNLLRFPLLLFSLVPLIVGSIIADPQSSSISFRLLILEIVTLIFFQSAANLLNDYYDHKSDSDEFALVFSKLNAGSRFLQLGLINEGQIKNYSITSLLLGTFLGLYINYIIGGIDILVIGVVGALIILIYTMPPIQLSYRWYGDFVFAFTIFPLIIIGSSYVQTQRYSYLFEIGLIGLSMASFVVVILFVGNIMSYDAEKAAMKSTFTVKYGKKHTITAMYVFLSLHYLIELILFSSISEFLLLIPIIGSASLAFYGLKLLSENINNIIIQEKSFRKLVYAFLLNYISIVVFLSL